MERTRSNLFTFLVAIFSNTEVNPEGSKKFDRLSNKDYENAGITADEIKELQNSLSKIRGSVSKIAKGKEDKKKNKMVHKERITPAKYNNPIYDQGHKINGMEEERTRDK